MRPTRLALAALWTLATAGAVAAQAKPDFSGTWKFNAEKSDPMGGRPGGGGPPAGGAGMMNVTLAVTQAADKLVIVQTRGEQSTTLTYFLDGRESVNPGMRGAETKSTARWDGASLVIEGSTTMSGPNGEMTITSREVRTLSEDGKVMTVVTTSTTPMGERTRKAVYDRQ